MLRSLLGSQRTFALSTKNMKKARALKEEEMKREKHRRTKKRTTKTPQPSSELVMKDSMERKQYSDKMTELRKNLVEKGVHLETQAKIGERKAIDALLKTGYKYTPLERAEKKASSARAHATIMKKAREEFIERERKRITSSTLCVLERTHKKKLQFERNKLDLARDLEQTWGRPCVEDLKCIVPVNAPWLGILPIFHRRDIAELYGDSPEHASLMYGLHKLGRDGFELDARGLSVAEHYDSIRGLDKTEEDE